MLFIVEFSNYSRREIFAEELKVCETNERQTQIEFDISINRSVSFSWLAFPKPSYNFTVFNSINYKLTKQAVFKVSGSEIDISAALSPPWLPLINN